MTTKVALSYKFTGVSLEELSDTVWALTTCIRDRALGVFSSLELESFFQENKMNSNEIYEYCLDEFKSCNVVLAFINHEQPSTGMQKEMELAQKEGKKFYLIIRRNLGFYEFREIASQDRVFEFDDISEIPSIIKTINFLED
mgnify:CR=1 FL=1